MQTPFREQVRLFQRWQAHRTGERHARVFVPAGWAKQRVLLTAERLNSAAGAIVNGKRLPSINVNQQPDITDLLAYGAWNEVELGQAPVDSVKLVSVSEFRIANIAARCDGDRCLSVTIELGEPRLDGERKRELCSIYATLTNKDGRQAGALDLTVVRKACCMTIAMETAEYLSGPYRLKVVVCSGDRVVDNARLDLTL